MNQRMWLSLPLGLACYLGSSNAHAAESESGSSDGGGKNGWVLGADFSAVGAFDADSLSAKAAFALEPRLAYELHLLVLYIRPEVASSFVFHNLATDKRLTGGFRVGIPFVISPAIYGHLGHGWYAPGTAFEENGMTGDIGLALDARGSMFSCGIHAGVIMNPDPIGTWGDLGGHVEFRF